MNHPARARLAEHEDEKDPLGAAPPAGLAEKYAIWRTAHRALDLPNAGADAREMSDGQLRGRVAAYEESGTNRGRRNARIGAARSDGCRELAVPLGGGMSWRGYRGKCRIPCDNSRSATG